MRWAKSEWKYFTTGKLQGAKKSNSAIKKLLPKTITFMESSCLWFSKAQNWGFESDTPPQYLTKINDTLDEKRCFLILHTEAA